MSTAVHANRAHLRRTVTTSSSVPSSTGHSPFDSPVESKSSTSLSSLSAGEDDSKEAPLIDGYGNVFELPDFTINELRAAIPAHCFKRSGLKGLGYVFRDMILLGTTFYIFHNYVTPQTVPNVWIRAPLWGLYTFLQGLFGTGLWVLAHECGHQSFSTSKVLNDTVGWIVHSSLLVPYFSWKISHGKHHKATGHMERDMVFLPKTRDEYASIFGKMAHELTELMEETPLYTLYTLLGNQLVGWPMYLITNVTGHNYHGKQIEGKGQGKRNGFGGGVNHFYPSSPLYEHKDEHLIILSDIGIGLAFTALYFLGTNFGWLNLLVWYGIPYLWVNHWLVCITYLQHTDPSLPHYDAKAWNYVRGAAATIDREFGFIGRSLLHGIIETHVLHHYVSTIPFYNADEATEAIKKVMGKHYRSDTEGGPLGFISALWKSLRWCGWVEPSAHAQGENEGVLFFRNRNNLGPEPLKLHKEEVKVGKGTKAAKMTVIVGDDE